MGCCTKIWIQQPTSGVPSSLLDMGMYPLVLEENILFGRTIEELNDINKIETDAPLELNIPDIPHNALVLSGYVNHTIPKDTIEPIPVLVQSGGVVARYNRMYVISRGDGTFRVRITIPNADWLPALASRSIRDLKFSTVYTYDKALILNTNTNNNLGYVDGATPFVFPLAYYGGWINRIERKIEDFRPWMFVLPLLRQMFCEAGYEFKCPLLESDEGRKIITYLYDRTTGQDEATLKSKELDVRFLLPMTPDPYWVIKSATIDRNWQSLPFNTIIQDPSSGYNTANGHFSGSGIYDVTILIKLRFRGFYDYLNNPQPTFTLKVNLVLEDIVTGDSAVIDTFQVTGESALYSNTSFNFIDAPINYTDLRIDPGSKIYVTVEFENVLYVVVMPESYMVATPKVIFRSRGDIFKIQDWLHDYNQLAVLKGVSHLFNFKFDVNYALKTVTAYTPYDTKLWDQLTTIEGYYLGTKTIDIEGIKVCDSETVFSEVERDYRYYLLKYNSDGDYFVQQETKKLSIPYHAYRVDYKDAINGDNTKTNENPFYESTVTQKKTVNESSGFEIDMMYLANNYEPEKPRPSYDINPRIAFWHGLTNQYPQVQINGAQTIISGYATHYDFEGVRYNLIPYAYTSANAFLSVSPTSKPKRNLKYGVDNVFLLDLFSLFYQKYLWNFENNKRITAKAIIGLSEFMSFSARYIYQAKIFGVSAFARLTKIIGASACDATEADIELVPNKVSLTACGVPNAGNPTTCGQNNPQIVVTKAGNCYTWTIGGTSTSAINSVTYQYSTDSGVTWVNGTTICSPSASVLIRMEVDYSDNCPNVIRQQTIDACGNSASIQLSYNSFLQCFSVAYIQTLVSPLTSATTTYITSSDNGATWTTPQTYNPNCQTIPTGTTNVKVTVLYDFADGCDDITVENELIITTSNTTCPPVNLGVICQIGGLDDGKPIRTGTIPPGLTASIDIIQYSYSPLGPWAIWDEKSKLNNPCPVYLKRAVIWCEDCPNYCSQVYTCSCTSCSIDFTFCTEEVNGGIEIMADIHPDSTCNNPVYVWYKQNGSVWDVIQGATTDTYLAVDDGLYRLCITCNGGCQKCEEICIMNGCIPFEAGSENKIVVCKDSCPTELRLTHLSVADTGGSWTQVGFNVNNENGPFVAGGTSFTLNGDNPTLTINSNTIAGYYQFKYEGGLGSCYDSQLVRVLIVDKPNVGTSTSITVCDTDNTLINIHTLLGATPGGTITVNGTPDAGSWSLGSSIFDQSIHNTPGTYVFTLYKNTVPPAGWVLANCADCATKSSQLTVIVLDTLTQGNATNIQTC